jgi:phosphoenolpyruvate phosphomutase
MMISEDKSRTLRNLLDGRDLSFLMEAHDGVSARIAERAGFLGIWASGLSISTSMGLRDCNEASSTQVLQTLEYMADATSVPILVDGDTGYGNFNNVRQFVRKLCTRGIAGVCFEDKLFPKQNSFVGEQQPLAGIEEFCGKVQAAKDSQLCASFSVVARVEALISGHSMNTALERATRYHAAGADAILIHSKKSTADEILEFARLWDGRAPLVIVPTKYCDTPTSAFRAARISTVIWANHSLRAAVRAMEHACRSIQRQESVSAIEREIASVEQLFELMDYDELAQAERRYLPVLQQGAAEPA